MSRDGFSHFRADGTPKDGYNSFGVAHSYKRKLQKTIRIEMVVYRCRTCKLYHVGKGKTSWDYILKQRRIESTENRLVGKLIGVLRGRPFLSEAKYQARLQERQRPAHTKSTTEKDKK